MSASELLEVGAMFGSIVGVWFALVGWKLLPPADASDSLDAPAES